MSTLDLAILAGTLAVIALAIIWALSDRVGYGDADAEQLAAIVTDAIDSTDAYR